LQCFVLTHVIETQILTEFVVDQQTGVISAAQSLTQREQSKYSLTVVARDSTAPYGEVVCPVNIIVISSQQSNLPIFVQPPNEGYTYTIPEAKVQVQTYMNFSLQMLIFPSNCVHNCYRQL